VIGEVRLADVLVAPSPDAGNAVFRLAGWSPAVGRWAADRETKVSTHFAGGNMLVSKIVNAADLLQHTDNGLLILAAVFQLEQLSSA
jgi:hypothetical protein